jgi:hypothetical protein
MYFTLAVSAATTEACAALAGAAERTDPRVMPIPGPARVTWRAPGWAAAVTGRLGDPDPAMAGAFFSLGYPIGDATPFRGVRALGGDRELRLIDGRMGYVPPGDARPTVVRAAREDEGPAGAEAVARALTEAVWPLGGADPPSSR